MVEKTIWENDKNNFNTSFDITEWINEVKRSINF